MFKQPPKYDQLVVRKARHDLSLKSHQSRHHPGTIINIIISISSHLSIIVSTSIITSAMTRALEVINRGTNQAQSSSPSLSKYHRHHNHRQHHEHQHHHEKHHHQISHVPSLGGDQSRHHPGTSQAVISL